MANFPTTTEELEEYISNYMDAHIAEHLEEISNEQIAQAVIAYMQANGVAIEDNDARHGEVPLIADEELDAENASVPMARLSNGVPTSFFQARVRAIAIAAAALITHADISIPIVVHTASATSLTIRPNVLHLWSSAMTAISITQFTGNVSGQVNEYMLQFVVSGNNFSLSLPSGVRWSEEPEWEDGNTYQVSIVDNLAIYAEWEAAST